MGVAADGVHLAVYELALAPRVCGLRLMRLPAPVVHLDAACAVLCDGRVYDLTPRPVLRGRLGNTTTLKPPLLALANSPLLIAVADGRVIDRAAVRVLPNRLRLPRRTFHAVATYPAAIARSRDGNGVFVVRLLERTEAPAPHQTPAVGLVLGGDTEAPWRPAGVYARTELALNVQPILSIEHV